MEKICTNCGQPMRMIPAGVSKKTGKPYSAFFKCKICGYGENAPTAYQQQYQQQQPAQAQPERPSATTETLMRLITKVTNLEKRIVKIEAAIPNFTSLNSLELEDDIKPGDIPF